MPNWRIWSFPNRISLFEISIDILDENSNEQRKKSLVHLLYEEISENIQNREFAFTWCWQIKKFLKKIDLENIWNIQNTLNRKSFLINLKIRLMEYFRTQWITAAKNSHTGLDYLELTQFECNLKHYLFFNLDLHEVKEILKLRTVNHDLAVRLMYIKIDYDMKREFVRFANCIMLKICITF